MLVRGHTMEAPWMPLSWTMCRAAPPAAGDATASVASGLAAAHEIIKDIPLGETVHLVVGSDAADAQNPQERAATVAALSATLATREAAGAPPAEVSTISVGRDTDSAGALVLVGEELGGARHVHHSAPDSAALDHVLGCIVGGRRNALCMSDFARAEAARVARAARQNASWHHIGPPGAAAAEVDAAVAAAPATAAVAAAAAPPTFDNAPLKSFGSPELLLPLGVALVLVLAFTQLLKNNASEAIVAALALAPCVSLALALWLAKHHDLLPEYVEHALVFAFVVGVASAAHSVYALLHAAVSVSLGAAALADMPSLFLLQAALMLPLALWTRFIAVAVTGRHSGYVSVLLERLAAVAHAPPQETAARLREAAEGVLHLVTKVLTYTASVEELRSFAHGLTGAALLLQLALVVATLSALINIAVARATAARFFGFASSYGLGAVSVFGAVLGSALGTATAAGLLYSAAAVADRAVRLVARGHALFANAFLLFAALATASSFVEMPAFLLAWHVTHELLVEAAVTFGVLAYGVEAVWSATFAPMAASANGLVCVVAGVTTDGFAAAGAEAVALAEREPVVVGSTAAAAHAVARVATVVLSALTVGASYALSVALGVYDVQPFVVGAFVAVVFVAVACEAIFTATMASLVCLLEQRAADELLGAPGTRRKSRVEVEAAAALEAEAEAEAE